MTYDEWKQETPPESEESECAFCGEPCTGEFCDSNCKKAYKYDNK